MSNIDIEVVDVVVENMGKYNKMTVTHRVPDNRGQMKVDSKALVDFATPGEVWAQLKDAVRGDHFQIQREKDQKEGKYWQWIGIARQDGPTPLTNTSAPAESKAAAPNRFAVLDDKDNKRQRLIVRQSSLAQAVAYHAAGLDAEGSVLQTAQQFADWVFQEENE